MGLRGAGFVAIGKELVEGLSLDKETVAWARYKYKETMGRARGILHGRARGNCTLAGRLPNRGGGSMATTVDRRTWLLEVADDRRGPQQLQAIFASSTSYNFVS